MEPERIKKARRLRDKLLASLPVLRAAWDTYDKQVSLHKTSARTSRVALRNVQNAETYTIDLLLKTVSCCTTREGVERVRKTIREHGGGVDVDGGLNHYDGLGSGEWNITINRPCSDMGRKWWDREQLPEQTYEKRVVERIG